MSGMGGQISDDRLEEIKIEHYNRKMMGVTQFSGQANGQGQVQAEKHVSNLAGATSNDNANYAIENEKGATSEN